MDAAVMRGNVVQKERSFPIEIWTERGIDSGNVIDIEVDFEVETGKDKGMEMGIEVGMEAERARLESVESVGEEKFNGI